MASLSMFRAAERAKALWPDMRIEAVTQAQENTRRRTVEMRFDLMRLAQFTGASRIDDATRTDERIEIKCADRLSVRRIMQGCVGMGAAMNRQRHLRDIDRAVRPDAKGLCFRISGIAGKSRHAGIERLRNIDDAAHVTALMGV